MARINTCVTLSQHRTIRALRLKHRAGGCGTSLAVSALRIMRYCPYFMSLKIVRNDITKMGVDAVGIA